MADPEVIAINRMQCMMVLDTGEVVPMRNMLAPDGSETHDPFQANACTGQMANGKWLAVDLTAFDRVAAVH